MNPWEWITTTTSFDNVLTTLGLGALAFLFARDIILTKGQHLRRVQDLVEHHAREMAAAKERLDLVDESRKEWKAAAEVQRERADKATDTVGEMADAQRDILHVLESLDQALRGKS